jgi:hypothetical protein
MDMMLLGETILDFTDAAGVEYGFWMPARGNKGVAGVEVFRLSTANAFDVDLETKSSDEADSAATSIGSVTLSSTTPQVYKFDVSDAKDLVRYKITTAAESMESVHLQFTQPMWAPD